MLINFNKTKESTVPGMNNGTGMMTAKMYMDEQGKIIPCAIHKGGSIAYTSMKQVMILTISYQVMGKQPVTGRKKF